MAATSATVGSLLIANQNVGFCNKSQHIDAAIADQPDPFSDNEDSEEY